MDSIQIKVNDVEGRIIQVGLLHTWVLGKDKQLYMVGNKYLEENPVEIMLSSDQMESLKLGTSFSFLPDERESAQRDLRDMKFV